MGRNLNYTVTFVEGGLPFEEGREYEFVLKEAYVKKNVVHSTEVRQGEDVINLPEEARGKSIDPAENELTDVVISQIEPFKDAVTQDNLILVWETTLDDGGKQELKDTIWVRSEPRLKDIHGNPSKLAQYAQALMGNEIAPKTTKNLQDIFKEGMRVKAKLIKDESGWHRIDISSIKPASQQPTKPDVSDEIQNEVLSFVTERIGKPEKEVMTELIKGKPNAAALVKAYNAMKSDGVIKVEGGNISL